MAKINQCKKIFFIILGCIGLIMFACNFLTDYMADDYAYFFSFVKGGGRIHSVADIFPSMAAHYSKMNGRIVAHFFVQLSLLLPKLLFDIVNTIMFLLQINLIYKIANANRVHNAALLLSIFGLLWIYEPAFGQVNFWQTGACNYLWCGVVNLLFLIPIINKFLYDKEIQHPAFKAAYIVFSLFAGCYGENASMATLIMSTILLLCCLLFSRNRINAYFWIAVLSFSIGFGIMMLAPATGKNKIAQELSVYQICANFVQILWFLHDRFMALIIAFSILFTMACTCKCETKILILAGVLMIGALIASFVFIIAAYFVERSAFYTAILMILACVLLFADIWSRKYHEIGACVVTLICVFAMFYLIIGGADIIKMHQTLTANERLILENKANGIMEIQLVRPYNPTEYSAINGLQYLDPDNPKTWPNIQMAKYYGVKELKLAEKED